MEHIHAGTHVREWYEAYVKRFHRNDHDFMQNINLKYDHTERVVIEARGISNSLNLSQDSWKLVAVAALLHDVGRYKQLEQYGTFADRDSVNHAELSLEVIDAEDVLRYLSKEEQKVVVNAIRYHNTITIPDGLDAESEQAVRILRDADKIDIWCVLAEHYTLASDSDKSIITGSLSDIPTINEKIIKDIQDQSIVHLGDIKSIAELKLLQVAWIYDLNFPWSFQVVEYRQYLPTIIKTLPSSKSIDGLTTEILGYLGERSLAAKKSGLKGR